MKTIKTLFACMFLFALAACGGGGGDPGSTGGGTAGGSAGASTLVLTLDLVDGSGVSVADRSLSQVQQRFIVANLKTGKGAVVARELVELTISTGSSLANLTPSSGLTDENGNVRFQIAPASVTSQGALVVTATAKQGESSVTKTISLQANSGSITLSSLTAAPLTVQKGQAVNVSVDVKVNGATAASNSVAVTFTTNCGVVSPASSLVDSTGRASAVIQTNQSGSCGVNATGVGSNTLSSTYTVNEPPIAALRFVSALPEIIYQSSSPGVRTSLVRFRLVDAVGNPVQGRVISASLSNTDGGINFCGSPSSGPTDAAGEVVFSVCSGTLPTFVTVTAELVGSSPRIFTNSNRLTVQTGLGTQRFFDISASQLNYYVGGLFTSRFSGKTTDINVYIADRQGNPVPDGTPVVFVSEGGQLNTSGNSSCILSSGGCKVQLIGQDYRPLGSAASEADPRPGRVTVLAYADGEESFIDSNQNNRYDSGELFEDLGSPYLEKDENGVFLANYTNLQLGTNEGEQFYPVPPITLGGVACPTNTSTGNNKLPLSVANTCNGVWDGFHKIRRSIVIVFSGGEICQPAAYDSTIPTDKRTETLSVSSSSITIRMADCNGNPLPADAALAAEDLSKLDGCEVTFLNAGVYGNTTEPRGDLSVSLKACSGATIGFKATVDGKTSTYSVPVP